jgi:two-component system, LytTR family, response regulator
MIAQGEVSVLIADDEPLARERIRMLLAQHPQYRIVADVGDGELAAAEIARLRPAIAFLDISMPGRSGVQVADKLVEEESPTAVVFVTAHDEYAVQAFEVGALDYLVKPIDRQRFDQMLARIERRGVTTRAPEYRDELRVLLETLHRESGYRKRFVVRTTKGHYFVQTKDIESVTADGNYLVLQASGRTHLIRETLKSFADSVDPAQYVRIHRSVIVNVEFIARIEPEGYGEYRIVTTSGARLESSRAYGDQLRALLK